MRKEQIEQHKEELNQIENNFEFTPKREQESIISKENRGSEVCSFQGGEPEEEIQAMETNHCPIAIQRKTSNKQ